MNYVKPMVMMNEDLAEGVFAASGGSDCYTVSIINHQMPEDGRGDYRFQVNGVHAAADNHHSGVQVLTVMFNQPNVKYKSSNGECISALEGSVIQIQYAYHNNGSDNIGLGDIVVEADPGVNITGITLSCNYDCGQHTW